MKDLPYRKVIRAIRLQREREDRIAKLEAQNEGMRAVIREIVGEGHERDCALYLMSHPCECHVGRLEMLISLKTVAEL